MRPLFERIACRFDGLLVLCASILVPWNERMEWRQEWDAELWHVRQAWPSMASGFWRKEREVAGFCMGAFQDALCLRLYGWQRATPFAGLGGTARECMLALAAILAVTYAAALLMPGVRAERSLSRDRVRTGLVLIQSAASNNDELPTISAEKFQAWQARRQKYFDGFAFYRVSQEAQARQTLAPGSPAVDTWRVAHASSNLFALLGLPVRFAEPGSVADGLPQVVLSEELWRREFAADPRLAGSVVRLNGRLARIAGVAPDGSLELPGRVDAWLLEPEAGMTQGGTGFVVAHLTAGSASELWATRVRITTNAPDDAEDDLLGVSLEEWRPAPWNVYLFGLFLALLALPAITSVSLGEYSGCPHRTSWSRRLYRWSFLSAKVALLLPIVYFASLDLAYARMGSYSASSVYVQLVSSFTMCLFGLRWALMDQRQRCPVCLSRVAHPAQVGQASRTFLAWNGTELMCMGGHTLLHVPGLPTSWFSTQRWLYLDTSWEFLFAGPGRHVA